MQKPPLLMLVHRIPFPPNKGDKIRSFNLMKQLSKQFDIHLGCFVDDPFDMQYVGELSRWCVKVHCLAQSKWQAKLCGLSGFLTNSPITLPYYFSLSMHNWVKSTLQHNAIKHVLVYSSSMAQYVDAEKYTALNRIIDFVDIDSDKWQQYAEKSTGIKRWFFRREAKLLQRYEQRVCQQFNKSLFVSEDEASAFRQLVPAADAAKVMSLLNGVDTDYFCPLTPLSATELALPAHYIVFTGAMDYWANVDAVCWFSCNVWPKLKQRNPQLHFLIVGGNPSADVKQLTKIDGVLVTGRVKDVRPYIQQALFAVAPMLIARGIQNKVLEAMALNKPIVCTSMAMEGINAPINAGTQVADGDDNFLAACQQLLDHPLEQHDSQQWILAHFTWPNTLKKLPEYFLAEAAPCK